MSQGRNDPCSCGSGKKYKRCCAMKQFQAEIEQRERTRRLLEERRKRDEEIRKNPEIMTPEERAQRMKAMTAMAVIAGMAGGIPRVFDVRNYEPRGICVLCQELEIGGTSSFGNVSVRCEQ